MDDLNRFLIAHESDYKYALEEIKNGYKIGHWMWYIFPQLRGISSSEKSYYYGIKDLNEAKEYLENDILREHLLEISEALLKLDTDNAQEIFGFTDNLKLKSSMTLFNYVSPDIEIFQKVLDKFYNSEKDDFTLYLIESRSRIK